MKGDRVALATSEEVPIGTWFEAEIITRNPKLDEIVVKALNNGAIKGIGQWRNSSRGVFRWEEVA